MADLHHDRSNYLPLLARVATTATPKLRMAKRHLGVVVFLNVTAASGVGGLKVQVRGYDTLGNPYRLNIGGAAPLTAVGNYATVLYPGGGGTPAGDVVDNSQVPVTEEFDVLVSHLDGSSYTYSLDVELIP